MRQHRAARRLDDRRAALERRRRDDRTDGERLEEVASYAREAIEDPDPWRGLTTFLGRAIGVQGADRGVEELVFGAPGVAESTARLRAQMYPLVLALVLGAQQAAARARLVRHGASCSR